MLHFVFKRMSSSIWIIICLLVGSIMAVTIACAIPIYSNGILQRMLTKDLESFQRDYGSFPGTYLINIDMRYINDNAIKNKYTYFDDKITDSVKNGFKLPYIASNQELIYTNLSIKTMSTSKSGTTAKIAMDFTTLSDFADHITITNGRMFSKQVVDGVYEVVVTNQALRNLNLVLDRVYDVNSILYEERNLNYRIKVVGVFTMKDTADLYWSRGLFDYVKSLFIDYDLFKSSFVTQNNMRVSYVKWFYAFDYTKITLENLNRIMNEYNSQVKGFKGLMYVRYLLMSAADTLESYVVRARQLGVILWILVIPVLIMLAFYISMVSQIIVNYDENGIAVLKSRGAGKSQIFATYLLESFIIGCIALAAGPPVGLFLCKLLGSSNGFLEFVQRTTLPTRLSFQIYQYAFAAVLIFIVTMLMPVVKYSRTTIVNYKQSMAAGGKTPLWKKSFLDVIILAASLYGYYLYKNQMMTLSLVGDASKLPIDPLLFITSTLFILGSGLLFLRIYPYLVRFVYFLGKKKWSPVMYMSLIQVGRSRGKEQFLMLFIILAISCGIFSANSARTINKNNEDKIMYQTGADVVIQAYWRTNQSGPAVGPGGDGTSGPVQYFEPDYRDYSSLNGTEIATKVLLENDVRVRGVSLNTGEVKLMGIIPDEFARIAWFRTDMLPYHWYEYINLMLDSPTAFLLSTNMRTKLGVNEGDTIYITWGANKDMLEGVVYAFVDYWPTYNPNPQSAGDASPGLIVANYNYISNKMAIQPYQVWIKKKDGATDKMINDDIVKKGLELDSIVYKNQLLIKMKNDPMIQGLNGSLTLSFIACMIISTLGFLIYWIMAIQSRTLHFGIMRAIGLSLSKVIGMIACEQLLVSGVAIVIGFIIGGVAGNMYIPVLQIVYNSAEQVPPFRIVSEAADYLKIYIIVALMLIIGFTVLWRIISKIRIDQALKLGED